MPVIDETGLGKSYEVNVAYTNRDRIASIDTALSIDTAIRPRACR